MAKKKPRAISTNLDEVVSEIRKEYGDGSILQGNTIVKGIEYVPTGAATLDMALGIGGIPRGRIIEIFGPESSGKTTLCLEIVAEAQKTGHAAFIDVEHALDLTYAKDGPGVDVDKLLFSQPDSGEQALTIAERLAESGKVSVIVIDSVAALVPQAELDGELGDQQPGAQARLMSKSMRRLKGIANKTNTAIIFVNQIREKIGVMFGSPETTPGGRALKFYASVRIRISRIESVRDKVGEDPHANRVRTVIVKNKVAPPSRKAEFEIEFGVGINHVASMVEAAEGLGAITRAGSHYKFNGKNFQGKDRMVDHFENNPELLAALEQSVKAQFNNQDETPEKLEETEDVTS